MSELTEMYGQVRASIAEQREHEEALFAKRITEVPSNQQKRLDYGARTDTQPVYVGFAAKGLSEGDSGWLLYYLEYDGSNRLTKLTIAYGDWTNRTLASFS